MRLRSLLAAFVVAAMVTPMAAHADPDCTVLGGSSDNPQIADAVGDWEGGVTGTGAGVWGDINRESGDLVAVWFDKDSKGKYHVHAKLASLGDPTRGSDFNETVYVYFDNAKFKAGTHSLDSTPYTSSQYISISFNGRQTASFGYGDQGPSANGTTNYDIGSTTGTLDVPNGLIDAIIPFSKMGIPDAGSQLTGLSAETRFLVGATVAGAGGGLIQLIDDTSNADDTSCVELTYL